MGSSVEQNQMASALRDILTKAQHDSVPVGKSVNKLRKVWQNITDAAAKQDLGEEAKAQKIKQDREFFFNRFVFYLQLPLTSKEKTSFVDRWLEVTCRFAASFMKDETENEEDKVESGQSDNKRNKRGKLESEMLEESQEEEEEELPEFMNRLLIWLLDKHEVQGSQARFRICLMVNRLLKLMDDEASITEELFQKIFDSMLDRLQDKNADIRSQAVTALQRLQNPQDDSCEIMKAYYFHMAKDPSASVRKTVIKVLAACKRSLPHVLQKIKDTDVEVRKAAFRHLAEKIHIKSLTIAQRERVMQVGLSDRVQSVTQVVEGHLIPAWLRLCKGNIVDLLVALDVENSDGGVANKMMKVFFKSLPYKEIVEGFNYLDDNKLVPFENLTPNIAFYWKSLTIFLSEEGGGACDILEDFLPELTKFSAYLRYHALELPVSEDDEVSWMCTTKQLIEMTSVFDLADEVGRSNLLQTCKDILLCKRITHVFMPSVIEVFERVQPDTDQRIQDIAEIIAELRDPMKEETADTSGAEAFEEIAMEDEPTRPKKAKLDDQIRRKKVEIAKIQVNLNIFQNDMNQAVDDKDFLKAQEIKIRIDEVKTELAKLDSELSSLTGLTPKQNTLKLVKEKDQMEPSSPENRSQLEDCKTSDDVNVLEKCLEMSVQLLKDIKIQKLNSTMTTLLEEFILPSLKSLESAIRKLAIEAIGLCCLRDKDLAKKQFWILIHAGHIDEIEVRLKALAVTNDLLLFHGLKMFTSADNEKSLNLKNVLDLGSIHEKELTRYDLSGETDDFIITYFTRLLDDTDSDIRAKVAEGLCKLLITGVIVSPKLLQRLCLMWYNPCEQNNGRLLHILGTFFSFYGSISRKNQDSIGEAFLPTLKTLFIAPISSPLASVDIDDVAKFLIELTKPNFLQNEDNLDFTVHDDIAFHICNEIISKPESLLVRTLVKLFSYLDITQTDFVRLRDLKALQTRMSEVIKEKQVLKVVEKFSLFLTECLKNAPPEIRENEENQQKEESVNEANSSFSSIKTMGGKKKTLFNHTNNTLLPSPTPSDSLGRPSDNIECSSTDDMFSSPKTPVSTRRVRKTRIEETPEQEEEIIGGNIRNKSCPVKNTKLSVHLDSSEDEGTSVIKSCESIETFNPSSDPPFTSTQSSLGTANSSQSEVIKSFIELKAGSSTRKLCKRDSSTGDLIKEVQVGRKRSTRSTVKKSNKKPQQTSADMSPVSPVKRRSSRRKVKS